MFWNRRQPTLKHILSDCITQAVMRADGVDPRELETMLAQVAEDVRRLRNTSPAGARLLRAFAASLLLLPAMACPASADDNRIDVSTDVVIDRDIADGQTADPLVEDRT
jgi:hypothetical protein